MVCSSTVGGCDILAEVFFGLQAMVLLFIIVSVLVICCHSKKKESFSKSDYYHPDVKIEGNIQ